MKILLQKDYEGTDIPIIKEVLDRTKYTHSYEMIFLHELQIRDDDSEKIPIGSIEFVQNWLSKYEPGVRMKPIEVPQCLRREPFVKRRYEFVSYKEIRKHLPCFVKDVSVLKSFSQVVYREEELDGLNPSHQYLVSETADIKSEYRIYFIDGKIQNICNYDGDPTLFPDTDIIQRANLLYSMDEGYPKSYTMDIMISQYGTEIIEIHPFCAVGLYSALWGNNLIYAYRDGINYYKKINKVVKGVISCQP